MRVCLSVPLSMESVVRERSIKWNYGADQSDLFWLYICDIPFMFFYVRREIFIDRIICLHMIFKTRLASKTTPVPYGRQSNTKQLDRR